jgi:hypothetical protein
VLSRLFINIQPAILKRIKLNEEIYFSNTLSIKTPPAATWLFRVLQQDYKEARYCCVNIPRQAAYTVHLLLAWKGGRK